MRPCSDVQGETRETCLGDVSPNRQLFYTPRETPWMSLHFASKEVSEEDLLRHVKPDPGSSTSRGSNANDKKNNNKNKRSRPLSPEPAAQKPTPSHANTDVLDSSDSEGGGEAERLIGGDNDSRSETRRAGGFDRFPRRRRKKKQQKVDQTKDSGDGGGRGDSGKGGEKAKAKAVPQKFMVGV